MTDDSATSDEPSLPASAETAVHAEPRQRIRVRHRRRKRRTARWVALSLGILVLALLAAIGWLVYSGLRARTHLEAVRTEVHTLRAQINAGDLQAAQNTAKAITREANSAHDLTTGPIWSVASKIPYLGSPAETVRTVTSSISQIANDALPALISASDALDPATLRRGNGAFNLQPFTSLAPRLERAATVMTTADARIAASAGNTWFGRVNSARADLLGQISPLTKTISNASIAAQTVGPILGADGPKTYLVSFETEAELRGTGGLPGAFAILKADHGRLRFTRFENDDALVNVHSGVNLGRDYYYLYRPTGDPLNDYRDSSDSPHFPYAARIWQAEWARVSGQHVDGAATLDPTALSYLLAVSGPVRLPDGTVVSSQNVVRLTQYTAYVRFGSDRTARKNFLLDLAKAVSKKLISAKPNLTSLVRAAAHAVSEHRLLFWSADPKTEALLSRTAIAGTVPVTNAPYAGLTIINTAGTKLGYFLHASIDWSNRSCSDPRNVTATITLRSDPPPNLPRSVQGLVTGELDEIAVMYTATAGADLQRSSLDGKPAAVRSGTERGHPVYALTLNIAAQATRTIVLHLTEPGSGSPTLRLQPMVSPVQASVHSAACGS